MQINVHRNALKAASRFSGVKDVRYYLNGVLVQASPTETRLVGCDGHTMLAHQWIVENEGYCDIIIPSDAVTAALKWKLPRDVETLTLTGGGSKWMLAMGAQSVGFEPVDGKFVDYQRVVPSVLSGEVAHFNPIYLKRCQEAAADLYDGRGARDSSKAVYVGHNGNSGALVDLGCTNAVAVVMPMRGSAPHPATSAWVRENVATAPAPLKAVA